MALSVKISYIFCVKPRSCNLHNLYWSFILTCLVEPELWASESHQFHFSHKQVLVQTVVQYSCMLSVLKLTVNNNENAVHFDYGKIIYNQFKSDLFNKSYYYSNNSGQMQWLLELNLNMKFDFEIFWCYTQKWNLVISNKTNFLSSLQ